MIAGAIIAFILILFLMCLPHLSLSESLAILLGFGFIISTQIISYTLITKTNRLALTSMAKGMASVLIIAGGLTGFTQPLFARLMELHWSHLFYFNDYRLVLGIMPLSFVLGGVW